jgi:pimeloyl-ACP methyl ester carboxylesterase
VADRQIVYLHGFPGGPEEVHAFGPFTLPLYTPDRRHDAPGLDFSSYVDHLTQSIHEHFPGGPITLIGFSAGARMALELGVKLDGRVNEIILISAAAPLQTGEFLKEMAGRNVFGAAQHSPIAFRALTWMQSQLARFAPNRLFHSIFASAQGSDAALKSDAHFKRVIQSVIIKTLQSKSVGYRREILAYVRPWSDLLPCVKAHVTLWHGTSDNWTPIGMASALEAALPRVRAVHRLSGLSHYSTLHTALVALQDVRG